MRGADKGYVNEAAPLYMEFIGRQSLSKLGFTDTIESLDCFTAEVYSIIGSELIRMQSEQMAKLSKKGSK